MAKNKVAPFFPDTVYMLTSSHTRILTTYVVLSYDTISIAGTCIQVH